ncbi:hypothetical protein BD626DRAFT_452141 [Schizophyllum amplum]|uniref:P-loop containing nucleoside triphosphate hydrolase protein n=1 Tax=Schizophyllum amplum TaxID=97359 RepID=A0A550CPX1_9AGAR|nr:hypothetical protein BD626DRAFT_452141 [Auriculariopsis ampla]
MFLLSPALHCRKRAFLSLQRFYSTAEKPKEEQWLELQRKRKTEWKRQQKGSHFLDNLVLQVRGGHGGDGGVAFHREKYKPLGPPSGGDGGRGGDVYIMPTRHLTSLSSVPRSAMAEAGEHGGGSWLNGRNGRPLIIKVPLGTVVREITRGEPFYGRDEWEEEDERLQGMSPIERREQMRAKRWVHYPAYTQENMERDAFVDAEAMLYEQERERKFARRRRQLEEPIALDLDQELTRAEDDDAPLGVRRHEPMGYLIATGGPGGLGNPHFLGENNRSPKYATRGRPGERVTLALELKLIADIGLVGFPNAGKSTLLRALTGGRVKTEVAGYAFTTLNPVVGVVRIAEDGTYEGSLSSVTEFNDSVLEDLAEREAMERGDFAFMDTRNRPADESADGLRAGYHFDLVERFRFTVADNPGLIERASENIGLGHSFLKSMERSLALVYVVDLSGPEPWKELAVLRDELEKYQPTLSEKACMIIANKADLLGDEGDAQAIADAKAKLQQLEDYVKSEFSVAMEVIPVSARYSQNMKRVVALMQSHVEDARARMSEAQEKEAEEEQYQ